MADNAGPRDYAVSMERKISLMTNIRKKRINTNKFLEDDWSPIDGTKKTFDLIPLGPGQNNHTTFRTVSEASPSSYFINCFKPELLTASMKHLSQTYVDHWAPFQMDLHKIYECLSFMALILADHHRGEKFPSSKTKIVVEGNLEQTIENARSYFESILGFKPLNEKVIRRFISGFYIPRHLMEELNIELKEPVIQIGRELALDEKVRKITSFDDRVKNAKGLGTWTSLAGVRDIYGQSYVVDINTNEATAPRVSILLEERMSKDVLISQK